MRTVVCFIILFISSMHITSIAAAQDMDRTSRILQKRLDLYEDNLLKTKWKPDRGVALLTVENGDKIWKDYAENLKKNTAEDNVCYVPSLDIKNDESSVTAHFIFSTDEMYMFVYAGDGWHGDYNLVWSICTKKYKQVTHSGSYEGGYDFNDPSIANGEGCGAGWTVMKFEEMHVDSPLFLSITSKRCKDDENHHELLFHLDEKKLKEVEGSRMDMDHDAHPYQPWRWWPPKDGFIPREYTLSIEGGSTWTRKLRKRIPEFYTGTNTDNYEKVSVSRNCKYKKKSRRVVCTEKILKKATLKEYIDVIISNLRECDMKREECIKMQTKEVDNLIKNGFTLEKKVVEKADNMPGTHRPISD